MNPPLELNQSKIFTTQAITVGTFLGGPLAAGYLLYNNFKVFNEREKALKVLWSGIICTIILFGSLLFIPASISDKIPNQLIPLLYTLTIYYLTKHYLDQKIKVYLENGGQQASGWITAGISFVCLFICIAYILILSFFTPVMQGEKITVGNLGHEVFYDKEIQLIEAQDVAEALTEAGYFDMDFQTYLKIEKSDYGYKILLPVEARFWNDTEVQSYYKHLENQINQQLKREIRIVLFEEGFNGRKEHAILTDSQ